MPSLYIVIAIFIWSSLGVFVRYANAPVHEIIFYSAFFSLFFQGAIVLSTPLRKKFPPLRQFPWIGLIAVLLLLNTLTFLFAYQKTTISNAVFTHYIAPVVVAVLAYLFLKERITVSLVLSILISTVGLWVMLGGVTIVDCFRSIFHEGFRFSGDLLGILSGLLSGIFYAVLVISIRVFARRMNPYVMAFIQNIFMVLILASFVEFPEPQKIPLYLLMGALHSTIAPFLYYKGLSLVQANRAAILGYLEPVGAIIFSVIFLNEIPPIRSYIGGGLIILSGYITAREKGGGR